MTDDHWLDEAIRLAYENVRHGGRPFGALLLREGRILATGVDHTLQDSDPTAHAELLALRAACRELGTLTLPGTLLAASCEPCALCQAAALLAGVPRCIYAAEQAQALVSGADPGTLTRHLAMPPAQRPLSLEYRPLALARVPLDAWHMRQQKGLAKP
ncbi:nucleoside deaminase [Aggregicoccus sp. 17bor-14]|uniref:nucleoside deaminase n=1 Tax=Myxococcaceae TaxID=31 RepID=UPI00129CDB44|nr:MULTISPECIES: deaminase [Myxococcaceae]MBF5043102.1 nucleoside deaminase [Simulacricoccus sp. 17bor-14]MRI88864.1 nucleoside deaminase [Aggregicoccus sp. 17bor-14]